MRSIIEVFRYAILLLQQHCLLPFGVANYLLERLGREKESVVSRLPVLDPRTVHKLERFADQVVNSPFVSREYSVSLPEMINGALRIIGESQSTPAPSGGQSASNGWPLAGKGGQYGKN
jgi:hypothetical protein